MSIMGSVMLTFLITNIHGFSCPETQTVDTHQICHIFHNTNIQEVGDIDFNDDDYCESGSIYIRCDPTSSTIKTVEMEIIGLSGELDTDDGWPQDLSVIDLEQDWEVRTSYLFGYWDWNSLENMNKLWKIDIENNGFAQPLNNTDWNIIAALPSLTDLNLIGNWMSSNFSKISLNSVSNIEYLELSYNNFHGTMDVTTDGFISKFPQLIFFWMAHNSVKGHFNNLDVFSSNYIPYLNEISIENNLFSGQLIMTNSLKFADSLAMFEIDYNEFSGDIDWNIFNHLNGLEILDINDNAFTGNINWTIISHLTNNGVLNKIHLKNNSFTGYVDFSWMPAGWIDFSLDVNIHCDPAIYPCIGGITSDRTKIYCYSKSECEASCQCTPTSNPTIYPTTNKPTNKPTKTPTNKPTVSSSDSLSQSNRKTPTNIHIMNVPLAYITIVILALFAIFCIVALLDAKLIRTNDYFSAKSIIIAGLAVSDTVLDLLFAVSLLLLYHINDNMEILITSIAAFLFIIVPITFSIFQVIKEANTSWRNEDELSIWWRDNALILYFLSIITGSSYTAIKIVNCGALKLEIFNMGLSKQQQIKYNTKRIAGVVALENVPQMAIQIWYLVRFHVDFLPIFSIIFSLISIVLTILTLCTQRVIIKNQTIITIEFDISGSDVKPTLSTKTNGIKSEISVLLGLKKNLMEIEKPRIISQGLRFKIHLFLNDAKHRALVDYESIMNTMVNNGKLGNIIKNEWNLHAIVMIKNVIVSSIPSKKSSIPVCSSKSMHGSAQNTTQHIQTTKLSMDLNTIDQLNENCNDEEEYEWEYYYE